MAAPRRAGRSRFTLFVLLLASVTLLTLDARDFGPVEQFKNATASVISPLRGLGDGVFGPVGEAWSGLTDYDDLESENELLRVRVAELQAERIDDVGAAEELTDLKEQLGLGDAIEAETIVAEVVAGSISNFDGFVVEISRGRVDGLRDGMPVIGAGGGLIGRIEDVVQRRARVRLLSDPDSSVGALIVGTDVVAIVSGGGVGKPLEVGRGSVAVSVDVEPGDVLVTSGGARSPYPEGIPIGTVIEVIVDQGVLEKRLIVEPAASSERLRFVTVVLYDPTATEDAPENDAQGAGSDGEGGG